MFFFNFEKNNDNYFSCGSHRRHLLCRAHRPRTLSYGFSDIVDLNLSVSCHLQILYTPAAVPAMT